METITFESKKIHQRGITMPNPLFHSYLTAPWKSEYVKQKKDLNHCVRCAIAKKTAGVKS